MNEPESYSGYLNALLHYRKEDYTTWRNVGMALKAKFGAYSNLYGLVGDKALENRAYRVYDEWSKGAKNYNEEKNKKMWDSFKSAYQLYETGRQRSITVKTIMSMWREDQIYESINTTN